MPPYPLKTLRDQLMLRKPLMLFYRLVVGIMLVALIAWMGQTSGAPPHRKKRTVKTIAERPKPLQGVRVVLDPGHGGMDSGCRRRDCREDTLDYRFAATVSHLLREAGATVLYTVQSTALDIPLIEGKPEPPLVNPTDAVLATTGEAIHGNPEHLHQRALVVQRPYKALSDRNKVAGKGLYFLSIHHDDFYLHSVHGGHVLYDKRSGNPPKLALILARKMSEAKLARKAFVGQLPSGDARHLGVLNPNFNPVSQRALLEVATISNPIDRNNALSRQWRWKFAHLVTDAIEECEQTP